MTEVGDRPTPLQVRALCGRAERPQLDLIPPDAEICFRSPRYRAIALQLGFRFADRNVSGVSTMEEGIIKARFDIVRNKFQRQALLLKEQLAPTYFQPMN